MQDQLPDAFDSISAVVKFLALGNIDNEYYLHHWKAVAFANAFTRSVLFSHEPILKIVRETLPLPVADIAAILRADAPAWNLGEADVKYLDQQLTETLKVLLPVVRDMDLPEWLWECRDPIEGAFE